MGLSKVMDEENKSPYKPKRCRCDNCCKVSKMGMKEGESYRETYCRFCDTPTIWRVLDD